MILPEKVHPSKQQPDKKFVFFVFKKQFVGAPAHAF